MINIVQDNDDVRIEEISNMLKTVAPEAIEILENRFNILKIVGFMQPIGRRSISMKLDLTERVIRKEAGVLKDQGLLDFSLEGMKLTPLGENALDMLKFFFHDVHGVRNMEKRLAQILNIKKVILASTYADEDGEAFTLKDIGRMASEYLKNIITHESVIGITGGSTVASIVDNFKKEKAVNAGITVIPARGGIGTKTEYQANTLAERLADKLGAKYHLLFTPDKLSKGTIATLKAEPQIKAILEDIDRIDVLVFGIGQAAKMAERRSLNSEEKGIIIKKGAVSEAFGYYFNKDGEIVHEISTVGIDLEGFKRMEKLIAVAGGTDKAEAIISISKLNPNLVLVTDEGVARKIIDLFEGGKINEESGN